MILQVEYYCWTYGFLVTYCYKNANVVKINTLCFVGGSTLSFHNLFTYLESENSAVCLLLSQLISAVCLVYVKALLAKLSQLEPCVMLHIFSSCKNWCKSCFNANFLLNWKCLTVFNTFVIWNCFWWSPGTQNKRQKMAS